jgi:flagellin-like hook-associated protein FlgL
MADITLTPAMRANLLSLTATARLMDKTQGRIATGRKVNTALDDPTAFFTALGLTNKAGDLSVLKDSMGQGISAIESADKALTAITKLVEQMKGLTSSALAATTAAERSTLAGQFADLRTQIDKLAGDTTYSGKNLVAGRGTITDGSFTVNSVAASADLTNVSAIASSSELREANFDITVQQLVEQTTLTVAGAVTALDVDSANDSTGTNTDAVNVRVTNNATGVITNTVVDFDSNDTWEMTAAKFHAITGLTAAVPSNAGNLAINANANYTVQITESLNGASFNSDHGTRFGFLNGVDVTSSLGLATGRLNVWVEGHTQADTTNISLSISGTILTISDGTNSATTSMTTLLASDPGSTGTLTQVTVGGMLVSLGVTGALADGGSMDGESVEVAKGVQTASAGDYRFKTVSDGVTNFDTAIASTVVTDSSFGATLTLTVGAPTGLTAGETTTVNLTNTGGTGANDMKVFFNEDSTAFINTQAVDATSDGLTLSAAAGNWATVTNIDAAVADINAAITSLRNNSQALATNLGIIQARENFTEQFINVLLTGGDKLTLADTNEEAANMLALQTRQQLGIESLSMASQSAQSILALFR